MKTRLDINSKLLIALAVASCLPMVVACETRNPLSVKQVVHGLPSPDKAVAIAGCLHSTRHGMTLADCGDMNFQIAFEFAPGVRSSPNAKKLLQLGYENWAPYNKRTVRTTLKGNVKKGHRPGPAYLLVVEDVVSVRGSEEL